MLNTLNDIKTVLAQYNFPPLNPHFVGFNLPVNADSGKKYIEFLGNVFCSARIVYDSKGADAKPFCIVELYDTGYSGISPFSRFSSSVPDVLFSRAEEKIFMKASDTFAKTMYDYLITELKIKNPVELRLAN